MSRDEAIRAFLSPSRLCSRSEVLARPSPIPRVSGLYAWYFRELPLGVPADGCHRWNDLSLLYVGIAPKAPPRNGRRPSRQTLCERVRYHMRGNAEGSTLRLTLGCLLSSQLGIQLTRVGSGNRLTFGKGEDRLSQWLDANAYVAWLACEAPWLWEPDVISSFSLPLNLDHNRHHPFHSKLSHLRTAARDAARSGPLCVDSSANTC